MVKAIVGANWGDEGKGKITDMLAGDSDVVVRFQGGANAGHTIKNGYGKFALHILPSGVFHKNVVNIIGPGVALNIDGFTRELTGLTECGVPAPEILVSDRAQIVMPYHILLDRYEEERLGKNGFGSTQSGIAPFYSDKYAKIGFQVCELFESESTLRARIKSVLEIKNAMITSLYGKPALDADEIFGVMMRWREDIRPFVADTHSVLRDAERENKTVLLEGQLGSMKDTDYGIYPMVTSSSTLAGYGAVGAGVAPYDIKEIIAVVKAYSSAVGAGAFVSEIFGEEAEKLRENGGDGGEYGATTGRPRRMGWFDCVATRYGCEVQHATEAALTVVDALGYLDEIPVCTAYTIDGEETRNFPVTPRLERARPVFTVLPGWKRDISGVRKYSDLPGNCRRYIEFIENEICVPIRMVSNGPAREDIIYR